MKRMNKPQPEEIETGTDVIVLHHVAEALSKKYKDRIFEELPDADTVMEQYSGYEDALNNGVSIEAISIMAGYAANEMLHDAIHDVMRANDVSLDCIKDDEVRELAEDHVPNAWDVLPESSKQELRDILGVDYA